MGFKNLSSIFAALLLSACSNKNVNFLGPELEKPAYDGTLARVSIHGITDGKTLTQLQRTAREKFQENRNLFSGSGETLYTLNVNVTPAPGGIECKDSTLSYISSGSLDTHYTLSTLERQPKALFDVDIQTAGHHEVSRMSNIRHAINCGTQTAIATDAISRSMRIFDLLVKEANGLDVSRELEKVKNDKDLQGSAIVMRMVAGTLYTVTVPIATTIEAAADTDWSSTMSAAAKAADGMSTPTYDPLKTTHSPPPHTYTVDAPSVRPPRPSTPSQPQGSSRPSHNTAQPQAAPKRDKPAPKAATAEIQTRGTTNMHHAYDQALNLATTNADNRARQQCRENYKGHISTLSDPNMVKKECSENQNQEYRCVVQITHTCEYKR